MKVLQVHPSSFMRNAHQDLAKIGDLGGSIDRIHDTCKIKEFYSIIGCVIKVIHVQTPSLKFLH